MADKVVRHVSRTQVTKTFGELSLRKVPLGGRGLSFLGMGTGTFSSGTAFFTTWKYQH